jgi:protein involved in polysaccharide export with SLBB domain
LKEKTEIEVGDWVQVLIVGLSDKNEPAYQVESIEDDVYTVVQREGNYTHTINTSVTKLRKL